ncbi:recombination protein RecR [Candidatus Uhrbacteria bacterium]|nr:recombination protein RecR [Candidatus Uhrbacteria bacterium]
MASYPEPIASLIERLRRLPGVGPKTAERFVFHLLRMPPEEITALIASLAHVRDGIDRCAACGTFAERSPCGICGDRRRDHTTLCVVAEPADIIAVERTGEFHGVYHILGGLLAPIEGIGPEQLRIRELVERMSGQQGRAAAGQQGIQEIIFAFDPTIEGETTLNYLVRLLAPTGIRMTRIARGLPVGGDLEYADPITLADAFSGRRELTTNRIAIPSVSSGLVAPF